MGYDQTLLAHDTPKTTPDNIYRKPGGTMKRWWVKPLLIYVGLVLALILLLAYSVVVLNPIYYPKQ